VFAVYRHADDESYCSLQSPAWRYKLKSSGSNLV
jgi:hypothetical protein